MKTTCLVLVSIATVILVGCGNYENVKSGAPPFGAQGGKETILDFATIQKEVLGPRCVSCHTGRHLAYESYQVVKADAAKIFDRITTSNPLLRMPQGAPLTADEEAMLVEWLSAGAPEFASEKDKDKDKEIAEPPLEPISFADVKAEVLKPFNCVGCHSQYNDYEPTKRQASSILSFVLSDKMPFPERSGLEIVPVSEEAKSLLSEWVNQGAPEFAGGPVAEPPPMELLPTWKSLRNNVLGPKCILCHNGFGPRAPTDMSSYEAVQSWFATSPELFNFDKPEESHFVGSILGRVDEDEFFFDPMPFNSPVDDVTRDIEAVTDEELAVIKKWIELKLPIGEENR